MNQQELKKFLDEKVLQYNTTLLAILAKRTKNRTMFIQVSMTIEDMDRN